MITLSRSMALGRRLPRLVAVSDGCGSVIRGAEAPKRSRRASRRTGARVGSTPRYTGLDCGTARFEFKRP